MLMYERGTCLYDNPLSSPSDLKGFRMEGDGATSFPMGRMRLEATGDPDDGQKANIVFWCPEDFPDHIEVTWDFYPIRDPGLAIMFFAAVGHGGKDLIDPSLAERKGPYNQYHSGDMNALHVSYFRRKHPTERAFTTCNLRKSHGFHLVAQGADPIPSIPDAIPPYHIRLVKSGAHVQFSIAQGKQEVLAFSWTDDGETYGPVLTGGKIGFRQMCPLIAEYGNLKVHAISPVTQVLNPNESAHHENNLSCATTLPW